MSENFDKNVTVWREEIYEAILFRAVSQGRINREATGGWAPDQRSKLACPIWEIPYPI